MTRRRGESNEPIASNDLPRFVFVYGTLKKGHYNSRLLKECTMVSEAETGPNQFKMLVLGGFPGLVRATEGEETQPVKGEIYEISDSEDLYRLDGLEGHPNWYRRTPVTVYRDGAPVVVDTYLYLAATGHERVVEDGVWPLPVQRMSVAV